MDRAYDDRGALLDLLRREAAVSKDQALAIRRSVIARFERLHHHPIVSHGSRDSFGVDIGRKLQTDVKPGFDADGMGEGRHESKGTEKGCPTVRGVPSHLADVSSEVTLGQKRRQRDLDWLRRVVVREWFQRRDSLAQRWRRDDVADAQGGGEHL